jgi:hypothetical protein
MNLKYFDYALQAYDMNNYVPIQSFGFNGKSQYPRELTIRVNPEEALLISESQKVFQSLSKEAKQIIEIIVDCPQEIKEMLGYKKDCMITMRRIKKYFKRIWGKNKYEKVIEEVIVYVGGIK